MIAISTPKSLARINSPENVQCFCWGFAHPWLSTGHIQGYSGRLMAHIVDLSSKAFFKWFWSIVCTHSPGDHSWYMSWFSRQPVKLGPSLVHLLPCTECYAVCLVTQSCSTLCNPMDYTVQGILQARILEWEPFPSPGDLPNRGIEPRSAALQADSLPAELQEAQEY